MTTALPCDPHPIFVQAVCLLENGVRFFVLFFSDPGGISEKILKIG